jgi:chloramphenicol 3-O phosphotransferase
VTPEAADGPVVILNGAPRAGKTSIARAIQHEGGRPWVTLGVDASVAGTPAALLPGLGLRPGGERPDLEPVVLRLAAALFDAIAGHARQGFAVVADLGLHDAYATPLDLHGVARRHLAGLSVLFVGVHCGLDTIWQRRAATWGQLRDDADGDLVDAVERWQEAVHAGHTYDIEVDTSTATPEACAARVLARLAGGPPGSGFWGPSPG